MARTRKVTYAAFSKDRRRALRDLLGYSGALLLASSGCTVVEIFGDTSGGAVDFDLSEDQFAPLEEIGGMVPVDHGALKVLLIRRDAETIIALDRICPHAGCDMSPRIDGAWEGGALVCLCHNSRFAPDGRVLSGPAKSNLHVHTVDYDLSVGRGTVHVGAGDADAGASDAAPIDEGVGEPAVFPAEVDPSTNTITLRVDEHSALAEAGGVRAVDAGGEALLLIRVEPERFVALDRVCTHRGCDMAPSEDGAYADGRLTCLCHDSQFSTDGAVLEGPAEDPLRSFTTRFDVSAGTITVEVVGS